MMRKVKYTLPKAQSGMEVQNSDQSLNSHTMPWPTRDNPFSEPDIQVNKTLKPVDRSEANLEAEKGETAFTDMTGDGIPQLYKIGGNPHSSGGTPLNLPEDSFIFSKDKKMKIGGDILNSFGKPKGTKDKYTPAELSNQYQINDFRKVLADPDTDKLQRDTAEKMIANYNLKLAKLGLVQESSKGFPDGIPAIAMPYIDMMGIDPSQFVTPQDQGQMQQVPLQANYGGNPNYYQTGGQPPDNFDVNKILDVINGYEIKKQQEAEKNRLISLARINAEKEINKKKELQDIEHARLRTEALQSEELQRRKATIMRYTNNLATGSEKMGMFSFPVGDKDALVGKLKDALTKYQDYYRKSNPKEVPIIAAPQYGAPITTPVDVKTKPVSNLQINTPVKVPETNIDSIAKANGYDYGGGLVKAQTGAVVENRPDGKGNLVLWVNGKNTGKTKPDPNFKPSQKTPAKGTGTQSPNTNPPAVGDVDGKGAYVYTGKERTPEGLNPSSKWTTDELKAKYKEQGIDYENMTDKEAQAALYDKSDPYEKAYMWGSIGNTKKGLSSGQGAKFDKYKPQKGESFPTYKARLATAGYTPDSLNKELEPFKESFADSYRGVREAWLLDPYKAPAAAAPGKKEEEIIAPPIEQAIIPDAYKTPKPKWWLQDQIKTAGAFNDLMRIKKYDPWQATPAVAYGERTFFDPTRELASNAEQVNMGIQGASTFSGPQSFAATAAYLQGQGSKNAADIMGRYNNLNVNASNQLSDMNTGIFNQAAQQRAASATQLFDKQTVANQNFDNSKNMARQNLRQGFIDAVTNRANTYNLNTLYPQYAIDPTTGGMAYNPTGSNRAPSKNSPAVGMEDQITKIRKSGLSPADQDLWIKSLFGKGSGDQQTG